MLLDSAPGEKEIFKPGFSHNSFLICQDSFKLAVDESETGGLIFEDNLASLLRRLQGSAQHAGKGPVGTEKRIQFNKLKKELQKVIEKEEYERAAVIRDKIRELEK